LDGPKLLCRNLTRGSVLAVAIDVADTASKRNRGLLGRQTLSEGEGLWIKPCQAIHMWFMRFPIDALFLDREKRVVKIVPNLRPWRIAFSLRAHSVLELPAGTASRTQAAPGDQIEFERPA
jgi:uncharacterized protein